ncbi:tetracycline resistance [Fusarium agapanthi]|uniref:Tetracycline resistance n=1 Tax=Fusarium agapanthi TaxID=1803897 RepID=A0A9P5B5I1_9HYPO|nr:tetracycline resistance [Fusarium agapanthi]
MSSATFHPFSRLPTELQLLIWKETCALPVIPGRGHHEQAGLHYVNVDTVESEGTGQLSLRVLDKDQDPNGDETTPDNNRSAYMWDGGLWGLVSCPAK